MDELIFSVKALAALKNISIESLAEKCGIDKYHLKNVQSGRASMTADDITKLSKFTGVPVDNIQIKK